MPAPSKPKKAAPPEDPEIALLFEQLLHEAESDVRAEGGSTDPDAVPEAPPAAAARADNAATEARAQGWKAFGGSGGSATTAARPGDKPAANNPMAVRFGMKPKK